MGREEERHKQGESSPTVQEEESCEGNDHSITNRR
jgi:hypothetical protein